MELVSEACRVSGCEMTKLCLTAFLQRPSVPPHTREANRSREQF
jgi:hypothetical protein